MPNGPLNCNVAGRRGCCLIPWCTLSNSGADSKSWTPRPAMPEQCAGFHSTCRTTALPPALRGSRISHTCTWVMQHVQVHGQRRCLTGTVGSRQAGKQELEGVREPALSQKPATGASRPTWPFPDPLPPAEPVYCREGPRAEQRHASPAGRDCDRDHRNRCSQTTAQHACHSLRNHRRIPESRCLLARTDLACRPCRQASLRCRQLRW